MALVTVGNLGQYGIVSDAAPQELPDNAWSGGRNVVFRDGYVYRVRGEGQFSTTPSVTPYFLTPYTTATNRFWVHAGTAAVYADNGTTLTDITGTAPTGTAADRWSGGVVNGVLALNNAVDVPTYWGGDTGVNLATLPGWDANWRAKFLRPHKNHLFAGYITKSGTPYPHMVKVSSAAAPGSIPSDWDETDPALDTYENDLAETPGVLVDMLPLGDTAIFYKEDAMYALQYVGGTDLWRPERLPGSVGMLATGCAVQIPAGHVVMTPGDVVIHSGQGPRSILDSRAKRYLRNRLDATNYARSFVTANPERAEVWICFPEAGQTNCSLAIVWNWQTDTIGYRQLTNVTYGAFGQINSTAGSSWNAQTETWENSLGAWDASEFSPASQRLLLSQTTPRISLVDSALSFNGTAISAYVERAGLAFGAPDRVKLLRGIVPRIDAPTGTALTITVGGANDAEQAPIIQGTFTYTVGSSYRADLFASGRFLYVKVSSTSVQEWRLKSMDFDVEPMGAY